MRKYSAPGFKISFPEDFKSKENFPYMSIIKPQTTLSEIEQLSIVLLSKRTNFEDEFKVRLDPNLIGNKLPYLIKPARFDTLKSGAYQPYPEYLTKPDKLNIVIRAGDYSPFPRAKERLTSKSFACGPGTEYCWKILIPIGSRLVEVSLKVTRKNMDGINDIPKDITELENTWRPIIDSMDFDQSIIAEFPDIFEMVKNYPKNTFADKGLKLFYPEILKKQGDIFYLVLDNPITKGVLSILLIRGAKDENKESFIGGAIDYFFSILLSITELLFNCYPTRWGKKVKLFQRIKMAFQLKIHDIKCWYHGIGINPERTALYHDYATGDRVENLGVGDYPKFPGATEQLKRVVRECGKVFCIWTVLIPVARRTLEITTISSDLSEIEDIWQPLVESLELDFDIINQLPEVSEVPEVHHLSWQEFAPDKLQHIHCDFYINKRLLALYDSQSKMFDYDLDDLNDLDDDDFGVDKSEIGGNYYYDRVSKVHAQRCLKTNRQLMLNTYDDLVRLPLDFYLNTDSPDGKDPAWDQIIEGFIDIGSGQLHVSTHRSPYDEDEDKVSLALLFPAGVYKFRVYFGGWERTKWPEESEECCQIYFWPTDEQETNEIKVIKAFKCVLIVQQTLTIAF